MKTKLFVPQNLFSKIFLSELKPDEDLEIEFLPASLISKNLFDNHDSVGLIPTLDVLTFKDLYVSSRLGISFNALLSNAYLYFKEDQETIEELALAGDVTSNEIVLSKVLFREFYDIDIKQKLLTENSKFIQDNLVLVGDRNFREEVFLKGLSFSEEIIELINAPYINFLLACSTENALKSFVNQYENRFIDNHVENLTDLETDFPKISSEFININRHHIIFDFENQDLEGIKTLLQMPYYYGIIKEMIELKFV